MNSLGKLAQALCPLIAALALVMPSAGVAEEQKNKDYGVTADSNKSVVIMRVPTFRFDYTFSFSRDGSTGFLSRVYLMKVREDEGFQYISRSLKPGTYVMTALYQQSGWQSCFTENTPKFSIESGKVYYFGTFDAETPLSDIQDDAVERERTVLPRGGLTTRWDPSARPTWVIQGEDEMEAVTNFVEDALPRTTAEIVPLEITYSNLKVSNTERALQICG